MWDFWVHKIAKFYNLENFENFKIPRTFWHFEATFVTSEKIYYNKPPL
jgi:hypothetical protein